jgi:hypothetical protein
MTTDGRKRGKGFRPFVLAELRRMKRNLGVMVDTWSRVPSTVYYDDGDGRGITWHAAPTRRDRAAIRAREYVENQPQQLQRLIEFMEQTQRDTEMLIMMAKCRLAALESEYK